jgi:MFS superfamily sulfate permease-like transporter
LWNGLAASCSILRICRPSCNHRQQSHPDIQGAATFLRLPKLAADLERIPAGAELHVRFEHLDYIDHACLDLLLNWAKQHETLGGKLVIDWESLHAKFNPGNAQKLQRGLAGNRTGATE